MIEWLILTSYHLILGCFMSRCEGISSIVCSNLHFYIVDTKDLFSLFDTQQDVCMVTKGKSQERKLISANSITEQRYNDHLC